MHVAYCERIYSGAKSAGNVDKEPDMPEQMSLPFECAHCHQVFPDPPAYMAHPQPCVERLRWSVVREECGNREYQDEEGVQQREDQHFEEAEGTDFEEAEGTAAPAPLAPVQFDMTGVSMKFSTLHIRMSEARKKRQTPAMRHELWTAHFGLTNGLGREAGQDMIDKHNDEVAEAKLDKTLHHALSYRTILEKVKNGERYPDIKLYKYENSISIEVPAGMNGADVSTVTFTYANPLEVLAAMLLEDHLHENNPDNIQWDPKHVVVEGAVPEERVYDADIFSGDWARDSQALLKKGQDLLAVAIYSDSTNVTGSGSQSAHPIFIQVGNFSEEVRAKDGSFRPVAFFPQLLPLDAVREMDSFKAFKDKLFHTCLGVLLQPLKDVHEHGFELTVLGIRRVLVPEIAFFTQDSLEVCCYTFFYTDKRIRYTNQIYCYTFLLY